MVNWILFGILLVQVCAYFRKSFQISLTLFVHRDFYAAFSKDHRIIKLIIFTQLLLEATQTTTLAIDIIQHFTEAYALGSNVLNEIGMLWISLPLMVGLSTYMHNFIFIDVLLQLTKTALCFFNR